MTAFIAHLRRYLRQSRKRVRIVLLCRGVELQGLDQ